MTGLFDTEDFPPAEAWAEFKKMRKQLKKPMTAYAETLMIKRIRAYVDNGQDAQAMLDQSILHGWTNVYDVKIEQQATRYNGAPRLTLVDQNAAANAEAKRRLFGPKNGNPGDTHDA